MLQSILWGGSADEEQTLKAIRDTYRQYDYIIDPSYVVGKWVYDEYREETRYQKSYFSIHRESL